MCASPHLPDKGFTLIELSIVLVVIGLVVGGILVGQDLIASAVMRSQISQIEKFQVAVNTFKGKYSYLPGDIPNPDAPQFNFLSRGRYAGEGDGDGVLEGVAQDAANRNNGVYGGMGENPMVWVDLSMAHLIDGNFSMARPATASGWSDLQVDTTPSVRLFLPEARLGKNNYISTFSYGGFNYFALARIGHVFGSGAVITYMGLTVRQAYQIDTKMDDGFPQRGRVIAIFLSGPLAWAGALASGGDYGSGNDEEFPGISGKASESASDATCYDDGGGSNPPPAMHYSTAWNNGSGVNCALSFRFQ